jgi:hypothetical protein
MVQQSLTHSIVLTDDQKYQHAIVKVLEIKAGNGVLLTKKHFRAPCHTD